jgi:hypothetical protein
VVGARGHREEQPRERGGKEPDCGTLQRVSLLESVSSLLLRFPVARCRIEPLPADGADGKAGKRQKPRARVPPSRSRAFPKREVGTRWTRAQPSGMNPERAGNYQPGRQGVKRVRRARAGSARRPRRYP